MEGEKERKKERNVGGCLDMLVHGFGDRYVEGERWKERKTCVGGWTNGQVDR